MSTLTTTERIKFDVESERHLSRYIANRNKRTGKTWVVTRRYETSMHYDGFDNDCAYQRAIVTANGVDVRIYYRPKRFLRNRCWVRA